MNYRLYFDRNMHATYLSLPTPVRGRLALMLVDILDDPYKDTRPYGLGDEGDEVAMRLLSSEDLVVVLLVTASKTVTVLSISYLDL